MENKFEVGDRVVSVIDKATDITIGHEYVVTDVNKYSSSFSFIDDGGCMRTRNADNYRLVTPANDKKSFKVGDRVRLVRPDPQFSSETTRKGMLGTVKVCRPGYTFDIEVCFDDVDINMLIKSDQLELVTGSKATNSKRNIKELPNTVVQVKSIQEYNELMDIYSKAGWTWCTGDEPGHWLDDGMLSERTNALNGKGLVVTAFKNCVGFFWRVLGDYVQPNFIEGAEVKVLSLHEFKVQQGLEPRYTTATETMIMSSTPYAHNDIPFIKFNGNSISGAGFKIGYGYDDDETSKQPSIKSALNGLRKGIMNALQEVPNRLKRALNKGMEAMYQLGWINGNLEYTEEGTDELLELLHDEYEEKLGALAIKKVADAKKKAKECKSCE